jgi:SWI/SNF-related matrix-associated actin-dependent regulator of chromatin subfamily A3
MATHAAGPTPSFSNLSLSSYNQSNPIDLTLDDDEQNINDTYSNSARLSKRPRTENSPFAAHQHPSANPFLNPSRIQTPVQSQLPSMFASPQSRPSQSLLQTQLLPSNALPNPIPTSYRPAFAGQSSPSVFAPNRQQAASPYYSDPSSLVPKRVSSALSDSQVIDLTGSPSPPPGVTQGHETPPSLPVDLPPKTPVCIGQLTVTALVLYPVPYLRQQESGLADAEWISVRLHYEHNPSKAPGSDQTIHIKAPHSRGPTGEIIAGEAFGVVEQKVATSLGPMLGKGLIRLDGTVRKGMPNVSTSFSTHSFTMIISLSFIPSSFPFYHYKC